MCVWAPSEGARDALALALGPVSRRELARCGNPKEPVNADEKDIREKIQAVVWGGFEALDQKIEMARLESVLTSRRTQGISAQQAGLQNLRDVQKPS